MALLHGASWAAPGPGACTFQPCSEAEKALLIFKMSTQAGFVLPSLPIPTGPAPTRGGSVLPLRSRGCWITLFLQHGLKVFRLPLLMNFFLHLHTHIQKKKSLLPNKVKN